MHWRHQWVVIAVRHDSYSHFFTHGEKAGEKLGDHMAVTDILWRCGCGKVRHTELEGNWTLEEVRG